MEKNVKQSGNPFPKMEEEVLAFWDKAKTFEKSVETPAGAKPKGDYVFYDGPPFATGTPHYGHIVASVMKDAVPRFWAMQGYRVERKWGWDCHGLPIENIVEKEMGSKSKKDIEQMGVAAFNEKCRSKVLAYVDEWKKVIPRLGRWADMENSYKTMDLEFMESVWWVFKELWDRGLVYEDYRSMHICPRCETTLSQQEVAEGYKMIKDLTATVKFELEDEPGTYVLAWTTTPWTLIGNAALAIGENIDYSLVNVKEDNKDENYILATESINRVFDKNLVTDNLIIGHVISGSPEPGTTQKEYKILERFKGKELVGKKYKPLFPYYAENEKLENRENGWKIYSGDFVTTEDGTGVVHIAPAFGEDDRALGKKFNLPFLQHVRMDGSIKEDAGEFAGKNVKPKDDPQSTDVEIIKYLAKTGTLFHKEKFEHSYPHCWRCETPLINYSTTSWFVKVTEIKDKALKNAEKINWSPEHIKEGRFGNWLNGARDWSISRQRFWASVIPIWKCEKCEELKVIGSIADLEKLSGEKITDIHKHIVDGITFPCEKCAGTMIRIPDVLDTWFDSGSMPYAQEHYPFENKEKFEANFPAQFIAEGVDQTRAWFYYLHVIATAIKEKPCFKNVIVNGIVLAEDGKKMSKRLQNYPDPALIFEKYGADPLRYYLLTSPVMLSENLNFAEKGVADSLRKINMLVWNVYKFYEMFVSDNGDVVKEPKSKNILDQWIIARLNQLISEVTRAMEKYNLPQANRPIADFIDDLSTWYIRRSRDRFKADEEKDKEAALATTRYVLLQLSKVMAPFTPFIAEQTWQKATGNDFKDENKSVHLEEWPKAGKIDEKVFEKMEEARKIVELALAKRDEIGIKVRQPLNKLSIKNYQLTIDSEYIELIKDEVNVKEMVVSAGNGNMEVELDTAMTPELIEEGIKREIVRLVNGLRKEAGLTIKDAVDIYYETDDEAIKNAIENYKDSILKDTLAISLSAGKKEAESEKKAKVDGKEIWLGIAKK